MYTKLLRKIAYKILNNNGHCDNGPTGHCY